MDRHPRSLSLSRYKLLSNNGTITPRLTGRYDPKNRSFFFPTTTYKTGAKTLKLIAKMPTTTVHINHSTTPSSGKRRTLGLIEWHIGFAFCRYLRPKPKYMAEIFGGGAERKVMVAIDESDYSHYALMWVLENLKESITKSPLVIFMAQPPTKSCYTFAASLGSARMYCPVSAS